MTLQAAVLVAAVVASKSNRWVIRLAVVAAILGVAGTAAAVFGSGEFGNRSAVIVALLYLLLTPPAIVTGVIKQFREGGAVTITRCSACSASTLSTVGYGDLVAAERPWPRAGDHGGPRRSALPGYCRRGDHQQPAACPG